MRRTWAPRGQTPIQRAWDRHDRLSAIAALTVSPERQRLGLWFEIHDHNIRTADIVTFVRGLHQQLGRPLILICDRYSVHRSAIRQLEEAGASWLTVELLPAYAPELNPVEAVWNHTKYADLANFIPDDIEHLFDAVGNSLDDLTFKNDLKHSCFRWAKLPLGP